MLRKDIKVKRPEKTKLYAQKGNTYVYAVIGADYKKDRQYVVEKRCCVGKMIDDIYMFPNENYFIMFAEGNDDVEEVLPEKSDCLKIGMPMLLNRIAENIGMRDVLKDAYDEKITSIILDLISYMIIKESSVMQHYPDYAWEHFTTAARDMDDTQISTFLREKIQTRHIDKFLDGWNELRPEKSGIYISYDSTNINTSAEGADFGEFGHAKDNSELEQINISYAVDQEDATPLFYELYPGSIIDNSQCSWMVEKARSYGYSHVGFILDRGYFSKKNIRYFDRNGYEFLLMIKQDSKLVKDMIKDARLPLLTKNRYYLAEHGVYGMTKEGLIGESPAVRYFHIYYDNVRASEERNRFLDGILEKEKQLIKKTDRKFRKEEELIAYKQFFKFKFDEYGYLKTYKRDEAKIQAKTDQLGYFVIVTSENMTASEALDIYRKRDSTEKMFMSLKSGLGYECFRVHSQASIESKTHLIFLASIIRNELFNTLKTISGKDKKSYTVPAAIRELEKVTAVKDGKGKYVRRYGLTAKQKKMLNAFGITEKQVSEAVSQLNK